ncbi:hypothetical protein IFR05_002566 [Cadophora sp. M221]|nr:hypothetical protein IFR05_002566 [Cadophora sp. M221]
MSKLFTPLKIGRYEIKHRVVMAPLTRFRADEEHVPLPMVSDYYAQRASVPGTLLVSEGTFIAPEAGGFDCVPGIYNEAQIKSWKRVTDAVHARAEGGSLIFCQLWAIGRAAHPAVLKKEGPKMTSSGNIPMSEDSEAPTPMTEEEIQKFIGLYATAAKNAVEAGFDGVEIHGANGYLCDQFLQDTCNNRDDGWGGDIERRARFGIEVATAVVAAIGADRVGYRVSPWSPFQAMKMKNPVPQFSYLAEKLKDLKLAYLHVVESRISGAGDIKGDGEKVDFLADIWGTSSGAIILAGGYTPESAVETVENHRWQNVAIAFGRNFLATPDLPFRISSKLALNRYNRDTFYIQQSPVGYIDYPFSQEFKDSRITA